MKKFEMIKGWYDRGRKTAEEIKVFVKAGWITAKEFKEITGMDYE